MAVEEVEEAADLVRFMYEQQRDIGREAMKIALDALRQADPSTIPVNVAVQLLRLGADLERKGTLGIEPEGEDDPFDKLARSMTTGG